MKLRMFVLVCFAFAVAAVCLGAAGTGNPNLGPAKPTNNSVPWGYPMWKAVKLPAYADSAQWAADTLQFRRPLNNISFSTGAAKQVRIPFQRLDVFYLGSATTTADSCMVKIYNGTASRTIPFHGNIYSRSFSLPIQADYARARSSNAGVAAGEWLFIIYTDR